jgi:hypothetical protein
LLHTIVHAADIQDRDGGVLVMATVFGPHPFLPKRWIGERTIAWLNRCRRLVKDWECFNRKARAFLPLASIRLMLRKALPENKMIPDGPQIRVRHSRRQLALLENLGYQNGTVFL